MEAGRKTNYLDQREKPFTVHPYTIMLYLVLISISSLFLGLTVAYLYTRFQSDVPPIKIPPIFLINTLILVAGSFCMIRAKKAYREDKTQQYKNLLLANVILSVVFVAAQFYGWSILIDNNIGVTHSTTSSYLYLISGLHILHIVAGLPFLFIFLYNAYQKMVEPVSVLVYFSDPDKKEKLRLLNIYWHFLDGLWIYLVLFFYLNYLV